MPLAQNVHSYTLTVLEQISMIDIDTLTLLSHSQIIAVDDAKKAAKER